MSSSLVIAAFDFDHTLTDRDSLLAFLIRIRGRVFASLQLALLAPAFLGFLLGTVSRQRLKEKILKRFIGNSSLKELEALGEEYALHQLDQYIKPQALERLHWHQQQGHCCILISASLDLYLKPWAALHGFETVLTSQLEENQTNHATGLLKGLNCWGPEKVRRLIEYAGPKHNYQLYAYGDSRGDLELLNFADYSYYRKFSDVASMT